jgi:serine/threonine protein kinase
MSKMLTIIKISYVHDIWLTLSFCPWNDLFLFFKPITDLVNIYLHSFILLVLVSECLCLLHRGDIETVDFKIQQIFLRNLVGISALCTFWFLSYWMGSCNSQQLSVHHSLVFFLLLTPCMSYVTSSFSGTPW